MLLIIHKMVLLSAVLNSVTDIAMLKMANQNNLDWPPANNNKTKKIILQLVELSRDSSLLGFLP